MEYIVLIVAVMILFFAWKQFFATHNRKKHGRK